MNMQSVERYSGILSNSVSRLFFGVSKKTKIEHIAFELTNLCNSKCNMCHIWANKENKEILTTKQIIKIINDPEFASLKDLMLTGGEMYMRDDIPEIIAEAHKVNPNTRIWTSTNGLLYEKIIKCAEISAKNGIKVNYGVSLDGVGDRHDKRRRMPGNFLCIDQYLIPGLKKLQTKYPNTITLTIGMCLDEYGMEGFEDLKNYTDNLDVPMVGQMIEDFDYYLPEQKRTRKEDAFENMNIDTKLGIEGKNRILKKEIYGNETQSRLNQFIQRFIPTVHHYRLLSMLKGRDIKYECSSFRNFFFLRYDGKVTPCLRFSDFEGGDLKKNTFSEIVETKTYQNGMNNILKCDGCLNTWCTDWSMELNAMPFYREVIKWLFAKIRGRKSVSDINDSKYKKALV